RRADRQVPDGLALPAAQRRGRREPHLRQVVRAALSGGLRAGQSAGAAPVVPADRAPLEGPGSGPERGAGGAVCVAFALTAMPSSGLLAGAGSSRSALATARRGASSARSRARRTQRSVARSTREGPEPDRAVAVAGRQQASVRRDGGRQR